MKQLRSLTQALGVGMIALAASFATPAVAATPAQEALKEAQGEVKAKDVVENRFFLKSQRFEIAPVLGIVPNNPMVNRYLGGVLLSYHFSERLAAGGQFLYSPDLGENDLKDLTNTLVVIAHNGDNSVEFQQPLDKMLLGATFSVNWAPVYGKINLFGETVLNFDLYGSAGLGLLTIAEYYAVYDSALEGSGDAPVRAENQGNKYKVPVNLGIGMDFFLTQTLALKIDARSYLYVDKQPQYDPLNPPEENRLYNNFIASAGVSMFFPKMDPRITEF